MAQKIDLRSLYAARETLRKGGITDPDLEKRINKVEEDLIKNEILPVVTKKIEPALKEVQRELVLVVDYIPGTTISVHLSRKLNFKEGIKDAVEILPDPQVEHKNVGSKQGRNVISKVTRLRINFADGRFIQESSAAETFYKFVKEMGAERVRALGLTLSKVPLVSNTIDKKYGPTQKPLGNGWYLITHSSTAGKKKIIEKIASALKVKVKVKIV